ncbi:nitric oxide reductase activation protein NorD [Methanolobus sediminis]|uniref:Nitric oxide reductase activation protein NorD n=1 Tax=Methanolobus sediminis TaxID=3072978 RepID=A0AA51UMA2_9EURY|nr:nitric oxide reductase activation protein NorD [Methanolobus sediminis]WMW26242.1 nitric oxide reductase activation protein NorD [Methanolobus sediminis]
MSTEKITGLILSNFPSLESPLVSKLATGFDNLDENALEIILHAGKGAQKRGKRILIAYLGAAPGVYKALGKDEFNNWLELARKVSLLSISCCEGFFDSSPDIINKGGFELLEKWTLRGIELSEQNKWIAIAYFKYTGKVVVTTEPERFLKLVSHGSELGKINTKVAEAYFEHLLQLSSVIDETDFATYCEIVEKISSIHWLTGIELIDITEKILAEIPPQKRKKLLVSMKETLECGELVTMALFRNAGIIVEKTDDEKLTKLIDSTCNLANEDKKSASYFLKTYSQHIDTLELSEALEWIDKGSRELIKNKDALRQFITAAFALGKYENTTHKIRAAIVDAGIKLADIQAECLESYFENASAAHNILGKDMFSIWTEIGEGIALQDPDSAREYYERSVASLSKIPLQLHEEILGIADKLLQKEGALASTFFANLGNFSEKNKPENADKWANIGNRVYGKDRKLALDFFANSPGLLEKLDMEELEEWTLKGLEAAEGKQPAGKAYFSLESKSSRELVEELTGAVALKKVANILRYYALGLSGSNFIIRSMAALPLQIEVKGMNPIIAGNTIYLAPKMGVYENIEDNFKIYKLSVMHEVGHARYSSLDVEPEKLNELEQNIIERYPPANSDYKQDDENIDLVDLLSLFPNQILAATIFGILEDARVEYMIMEHYRGVRADLEEVRYKMLLVREIPEDELEKFMEGLLWISTGHEPGSELRLNEILTGILNGLQDKFKNMLFTTESSTISTFKLASEIYCSLDDKLGPLDEINYRMIKNIAYRGMDVGATGQTDPMMTKPYENVIKNFIPETEADLTADEERPKEQATDKPTQPLENNWRVLGSYKYDEWDSNINDYRSEWSTVNEMEPSGGSTAHYKKAMERYGNEISLLRHTFSLMKPEAFHRRKGQNDGTEIDIDAYTESLITKKCGANPDEGMYISWDKQERDVATLFLMDVSASTRKILGMDGRSILDVEKDALIIMSQALESIGDKYAIYAFSGKSKDNVEYFKIKEFDERFSDDVARRMSILASESNTRLGPAIRHSIKKLEKAGSRTKMLVLLSDGEPYDRARGEDSYQGDIAQEDTRMAISEGKNRGMHFFCITVDKNPGEYLNNIFSDVGYTIIDDVLMLPEMLPLLYKRLTT